MLVSLHIYIQSDIYICVYLTHTYFDLVFSLYLYDLNGTSSKTLEFVTLT